MYVMKSCNGWVMAIMDDNIKSEIQMINVLKTKMPGSVLQMDGLKVSITSMLE